MVRPEWLFMAANTWVILSVHALRFTLQVAPNWHPDSDTRVIAVGPAVQQAWQKHFDHPIEYHPLMNSEGVIKLLQQQPAGSVKILTNRDGRGLIRAHCMTEGISYQQINIYERILLPLDLAALQDLYALETPVLTATSGGILQAWFSQLKDELKSQVLSAPLVVGAGRIAEVATDMGFSHLVVARNPTDEAMCAALSDLTANH